MIAWTVSPRDGNGRFEQVERLTAMLKSISVENYRGFRSRTEVKLKPLTVLLGRNSSGKSSLTRIFPLLQQSLERQSSSPILWTADSVDLGNVADVITHGQDGSELRLSIKVEAGSLRQFLSRRSYGPYRYPETRPAEIQYTLRLSADGARTRFNGIEIVYDGQTLKVDWSKEGIIERFVVDDTVYDFGTSAYTVDTKSIFPEITRSISRDDVARTRREPLFFDPVGPALLNVIHGRTSQEKVAYLARTFTYMPSATVKDDLRIFPNVVGKKITDSNSRRISACSMINDLPNIMSFLEYEISPILLGAGYIGPARASGNRFDRIQELAVNRLNSRGDNTAMYVYSLSHDELKTFNDLMMRACGHFLNVDESGPGHVSIKIGRQGYSYLENIADVGFGFSQLVPVVAQLHAVRERENTGSPYSSPHAVLAVEQPELHLHPAMQANLADLFAGAINSPTELAKSTTIVVETHSETFISQVGRLIASGDLSSDSVAIYFVSKEEKTGESIVEERHFDEDGVIADWPIGFFSANSI